MAARLEFVTNGNETVRFRVFPQNPFAGRVSRDIKADAFLTEIAVRPRGRLWIGRAPDDPAAIGFGDDQIYVANYRQKRAYEETPAPHIDTARQPPSDFMPGAAPRPSKGAFVHLDPGGWDRLASRTANGAICASEFAVAMVYALARDTIDLWERYIGKKLVWYCAQDGRQERRARLEIVPLVAHCGSGMHRNAVSGYGYIELGVADPSDGDLEPLRQPGRVSAAAPPPPLVVPYWLNADTLAHELGHQILYATLGFGPDASGVEKWIELGGRKGGQEFRAFHESFGDVAAIMAALRSDAVLEHVLAQTEGFLYQDTALTNIGEVTATRTIRDVHDDDGDAPTGAPEHAPEPDEAVVREYYRMSQPLTGTFFDILASLSMHFLGEQGLISRKLVDDFEENVFLRGVAIAETERDPLETEIRKLFAERGGGPFKTAIRSAADVLGRIVGGYLADPGPVDPATFDVDVLREGLQRAAARIVGAGRETRIGGPSLERKIRHSCTRRFAPTG